MWTFNYDIVIRINDMWFSLETNSFLKIKIYKVYKWIDLLHVMKIKWQNIHNILSKESGK